MRASLWALLCLLLLLDAGALRAEEAAKRTWRLAAEESEHRLVYGTDNDEDMPIIFGCKAGAGAVDVTVSETGKGVKAGRTMTASLTAGRTTAKVRGKTMPNEDAGTPSFLGTLPAGDPLFAALAKEQTLVVAIGPSRDRIPLRDIGDKAEQFSGACRKK
jgi:hypothetical protein